MARRHLRRREPSVRAELKMHEHVRRQVPSGNERELAERSYTTPAKINAAAARLAELQKILNDQAGPSAARVASSLSLLRVWRASNEDA